MSQKKLRNFSMFFHLLFSPPSILLTWNSKQLKGGKKRGRMGELLTSVFGIRYTRIHDTEQRRCSYWIWVWDLLTRHVLISRWAFNFCSVHGFGFSMAFLSSFSAESTAYFDFNTRHSWPPHSEYLFDDSMRERATHSKVAIGRFNSIFLFFRVVSDCWHTIIGKRRARKSAE
jgi:hypothetical protein